MWGTHRSFQQCFLIVSIMFPTGDIGPQIWHWVAKSSKIDSSGPPNFLGPIPKKSLRSVLSPTYTRHVLKFRKDSFRGVDGLDPPLTKSSKIDSFLAPKFLRVESQNVYSNLLPWFTPEVWLSFVGWTACAKPGNNEERRVFEGKTTVYIFRR